MSTVGMINLSYARFRTTVLTLMGLTSTVTDDIASQIGEVLEAKADIAQGS